MSIHYARRIRALVAAACLGVVVTACGGIDSAPTTQEAALENIRWAMTQEPAAAAAALGELSSPEIAGSWGAWTREMRAQSLQRRLLWKEVTWHDVATTRRVAATSDHDMLVVTAGFEGPISSHHLTLYMRADADGIWQMVRLPDANLGPGPKEIMAAIFRHRLALLRVLEAHIDDHEAAIAAARDYISDRADALAALASGARRVRQQYLFRSGEDGEALSQSVDAEVKAFTALEAHLRKERPAMMTHPRVTRLIDLIGAAPALAVGSNLTKAPTGPNASALALAP